jgi:hypothetical protein
MPAEAARFPQVSQVESKPQELDGLEHTTQSTGRLGRHGPLKEPIESICSDKLAYYSFFFFKSEFIFCARTTWHRGGRE